MGCDDCSNMAVAVSFVAKTIILIHEMAAKLQQETLMAGEFTSWTRVEFVRLDPTIGSAERSQKLRRCATSGYPGNRILLASFWLKVAIVNRVKCPNAELSENW
jgi:hypothetical protein